MRLDLYVITDEKVAGGRSHAHTAQKCLRHGASALQLRDVKLSKQEMLEAATEIAGMTEGKDMLLIVCDDLDAALGAGADGVHIYESDLTVAAVRERAPEGFMVGVSAGTPEEALEAEKAGADYVIFGPMFSSYVEEMGPAYQLDDLKDLKSKLGIQLVAIGGIKLHNAADTIKAGADGVAVKSGALHQRDIGEAVDLLAKSIARTKKEMGS